METEVKALQFKHPKARRPQDDLPKDVVIHYIVKDYRRMFNDFEKVKTDRQELIDDLRKKIGEKDAKILANNKEIHALRAAVKRYETAEEKKSSLESEVKELKRKNELLVQAVIDPSKAELIPIVRTKKEKKWMVSAMTQLEKAAQGLIQAEEHFVGYKIAIEEVQEKHGQDEALKFTSKRLSRIISRIESCVSHVECFFNLVKDITVEEDGNDETEN